MELGRAPVELEDEVNTEFDEGTPSFSKDGNTMYYTYCAQDPEGPRTSEIYISSRSSAKWGKGTRANIVKDSVTASRPPFNIAGRQVSVFCVGCRRWLWRQRPVSGACRGQ